MEVWKIIPNYEGYEASSEGQIRNAKTHRIMSVCKNYPGKNGYYQIGLVKNGAERNRITRKVHTLVCLAFIGEPPTDLHTVNHKNGNKLDNRAENLEWMTRSEQSTNSYQTLGNVQTRPRGHGNHWRANYTDEEVLEIRRLHASGMSYHKITAHFGNRTSWVPIQMVVKRKTYTHI